MAWHIHTIERMFCIPGTEAVATRYGKQFWARAVCEPYHLSPVQRVKASWAVLTGKAHAVEWPQPGDLERVWHGRRSDG